MCKKDLKPIKEAFEAIRKDKTKVFSEKYKILNDYSKKELETLIINSNRDQNKHELIFSILYKKGA